MKRNLDLVKQILESIEEQDVVPKADESFSAEIIEYHAKLLVEAGLIHPAQNLAMGPHFGVVDVVPTAGRKTSLTWEGHEFLDNARDPGLWQKAKDVASQNGGTASFAVFTELLKRLVLLQVGLS